MQDLLTVLYNYVQENRVGRYLNADPAYRRAGCQRERAEDWLRANLGPEALAQLDALWDSQSVQDDLSQLALFRCGNRSGVGVGPIRPLRRIGTTCWPR